MINFKEGFTLAHPHPTPPHPPLQVARIVCVALQKYGGIFADNGSGWYFSGG
jgi:hypothetical protein